MNRLRLPLALLLGSALAAVPVVTGSAFAAPQEVPAAGGVTQSTAHNFRSPMAIKQDALRQAALQDQLKGVDASAQRIPGVAKRQYVELEREGTDKIFVVIAEFGDAIDPRYPSDPEVSDAQRFDGPLHNQIPEPDRDVDNQTLWQADYDQDHYENMYFKRMAKYFEQQSSGRYSVEGAVTEWVKVPYNQARYGRSPDEVTGCESITSCPNTWFLVRDAMAAWVQDQLDSGMTLEDVQAYLKEFDVQDRYDFNGDGNFAEPDGYIDHFQVVHAGGDQADGDPIYGIDAIWSHRWYANLSPFGNGPEGGAPFGGTEIGCVGTTEAGGCAVDPDNPAGGLANNPTGVWVGDYTIQPENGGLGVFAHEFAHDLGLPDLYDTSGNSGGAENSTGFWTLMSSGSNIGDGGSRGQGDDPVDLGVWEKLQLGWLNEQGEEEDPDYEPPSYDVAFAGEDSRHRMGPAEFNTNRIQALFVVLPDKVVPLDLGAPCETCGEQYFYSGAGDDLNNTMTAEITATGVLTAKVRYEIEEDWDYAFLEATVDDATWLPVDTNLSDKEGDQSGFNSSLTGITGTTEGAWVDLASTAPLPAGTTSVRFRYQTDGAFVLPGFQVDNITVGTSVIGAAETETEGWVFDGFSITTGSESLEYANYYVGENRIYIWNDRSLRTAYNIGFLNTATPNLWEFFPYQDGLLLSYWDESQSDNNVGDHPGEGLILPIDSHPGFHHWADGTLIRPRVLSFDSTFGLQKTNRITVHQEGVPVTIRRQPAVPLFDDRKDYWFDADEHAATGEHVGRYQPGWYGVKVPKTGTTIEVRNISPNDFLQVRVKPAE